MEPSTLLPYVYNNLDTTQKEIRLLRIAPGHFDDPIQCRIGNFPISTHIKYDVLSYSIHRSNPEEKASAGIEINGRSLLIPNDLQIALRHLRHPVERRILWVEAICVDQTNIEERSEHLYHLESVYASAQKVLIWLGEDSSSIDKLFLSMSNASEVSEPSVGDINKYTATIVELLGRSWFSDIWGVHALVFGNHCTLMCSQNTVSWDSFYSFLVHLERTTSIPKETTAIISNLSELSDLRTAKKSTTPHDTPGFPISSLLLHFEHYHPHDPRDKIFALLPLSTDAPSLSLDYTTAVEHIYTNLVENVVFNTQNLEIITRHHRQRQLPSSLPSWVPDWRARRRLTSHISGTFAHSQEPSSPHTISYNTSLSEPADTKFPTPGILRVKGFQHDTIQHIFSFQNQDPQLSPDDHAPSSPSSQATNWPLRLFEEMITFRFKRRIEMWSFTSDWSRMAYVREFWYVLLRGMSWEKESEGSENNKYSCRLLDSEEVLEFERQFTVPEQAHSDETSRMYFGPKDEEVMEFVSRLYFDGDGDGGEEWVFVVTRLGNLGIAPKGVRVGDGICVLFGGGEPFVLRRLEAEGEQREGGEEQEEEGEEVFEMLGTVFLSGGIMAGKAVRDLKKRAEWQKALRWFDIR